MGRGFPTETGLSSSPGGKKLPGPSPILGVEDWKNGRKVALCPQVSTARGRPLKRCHFPPTQSLTSASLHLHCGTLLHHAVCTARLDLETEEKTSHRNKVNTQGHTDTTLKDTEARTGPGVSGPLWAHARSRHSSELGPQTRGDTSAPRASSARCLRAGRAGPLLGRPAFFPKPVKGAGEDSAYCKVTSMKAGDKYHPQGTE